MMDLFVVACGFLGLCMEAGLWWTVIHDGIEWRHDAGIVIGLLIPISLIWAGFCVVYIAEGIAGIAL